MADTHCKSLFGSLLLLCFFIALSLSIAHSFFGLRYEDSSPCLFEAPVLTEYRPRAAAIWSGQATKSVENLTSQQLQMLLSNLRCNETSLEECFQLARSAGEARDVRRGHIQRQRALALRQGHGAQRCAGFLGIKEHHPDLEGMPEWMKPQASFQAAFADLSIVGLPKTGTTQLYEILGSHPSVIRMNPSRKENCAKYPRDRRDVGSNASSAQERQQFQTNLYSFVRNMALSRESSSRARGLTLNGCVNFASVAFTWYYLRPTGRKFIVLFRDPADWLWSSWNFFDQQKHLDAEGLGKGGWVRNNYRSPELFHELLTSRSRTLAGQWLVKWRCRSLEDPRLLVSMVGKSSVLFLKNEDLVPSRISSEGGLLDRVSAFAGIDRTKYDAGTYSQVLNCNNKKGFKSKCQKMTTAYKVSGGRTMLPETRVLLYLQFWELCKIWAAEFGVVYQDCLDVVNATADM